MKMILASSSPRRIELLRAAGFEFEVHPPETDESILHGESPRAMVLRLARDKANVIFQKFIKEPRVVVVAADTTVVAPGGKKVLGKPENTEDAARMLRSLQGKTHIVFTGYSLIYGQAGRIEKMITRALSTRVAMRKLSREEILSYVATGEPMDKAGAYAAQGRGATLIEKISGSYTNVVGLPISQVIQDLRILTGK